MALNQNEIEKVYYSIGEVADLLQVNTSLLRYWEKEFDILRLKKNAKGDRFFTKADIEKVKLIHHLVRDKGYTLDGAKAQLKSNFSDTEKKFLVIEKLQKVKSFLTTLKEQLS